MGTPGSDLHAESPPQPPNSPASHQLETPSTPENGAKRRRLSKDHPSPAHVITMDAAGGAPLSPLSGEIHTTIGSDADEQSHDPPVMVFMEDDALDPSNTFPYRNGKERSTPELAVAAVLKYLQGKPDINVMEDFVDWCAATFISAENESYFSLENISRRIEFWTAVGASIMTFTNSSSIMTLIRKKLPEDWQPFLRAVSQAARIFSRLEAEMLDLDIRRRDSLGDGRDMEGPGEGEQYCIRFLNYHKALEAMLKIDSNNIRYPIRKEALVLALNDAAESFITSDEGRSVTTFFRLFEDTIKNLHKIAKPTLMLFTYIGVINALFSTADRIQAHTSFTSFCDEAVHLLLIMDSQLLFELISDRHTSISRTMLAKFVTESLFEVLWNLLYLNNDPATRLRDRHLSQLLGWSTRSDMPAGQSLSPGALIENARSLERDGFAVIAYSWCVALAARNLSSSTVAQCTFGTTLLHAIVEDIHSNMYSDKIQEQRALVAKVIMSTDCIGLACRAAIDPGVIPDIDIVTDYLSDVELHDPTITDALWTKFTAAEESSVRLCYLARLQHQLAANFRPPEIEHLLRKFPTSDLELTWLYLDNLLELSAKRLKKWDLYTDFPQSQLNIVEILTVLVARWQTHEGLPHQVRLVASAIAIIKSLVHPRFPSSDFGRIVSHLLAAIGEGDPATLGSLDVLAALLDVTPMRVFENMSRSAMAKATFELLKNFVERHRHDRPSHQLEWRLHMHFYITLKCLHGCSVESKVITSDELWSTTFGEDAMQHIYPSAMLNIWLKQTEHSPLLSRLLLECICEGRINTQSVPPGPVYVTIFDFLLQEPDRRHHLMTFVTPTIRALVEDEGTRLTGDLWPRINNIAFSSKQDEDMLNHAQVLRLVVQTCLDAFVDGIYNAASTLRLLMIQAQQFDDEREKRLSRNPTFIDLSTGNGAQNVHLKLCLPPFRKEAKKLRLETWKVDTSISVREFKRHVQTRLSHEQVFVCRLGKRLDLNGDLDSPLSALTGSIHQHSFVVNVSAGSAGRQPVTTTYPSLTLLKRELAARYLNIYEHLYGEEKIGSAAAELLGSVDLTDLSNEIDCRTIEEVLDPMNPLSPPKLEYAVALVEQNVRRQHKSGIKDVEGNVSALRLLLLDSVDEQQRMSFFEDPESCYQLFVRLIMDIKEQVATKLADHVSANEEGFALGYLLECLYEAALCSSKIAEKLTEDDDAAKLFTILLQKSGSGVADLVQQSTAKIISMPDLEAELSVCDGRSLCSDPSYLTRGRDIKTWLAKFSSDLMDECRDDPSASTAVYRLGLAMFPTYLKWSTDMVTETQLATSILDDIANFAMRDREDDIATDSKIGYLCAMLRRVVDKAVMKPSSFDVPRSAINSLQRLLFAKVDLSGASQEYIHRVNDEWSRMQVYNTILALVPVRHDAIDLVREMGDFVGGFEIDDSYPGRVDSIRRVDCPVGLENLSMTCYLNSLLQQLFMNYDFRTFVLNIPITDVDKQPVLKEIQKTFNFLEKSCRTAYRPDGLAKVLDIDVTNQEDAQLFFSNLMARMEEEMPDDHAKTMFKSFYFGKERTQTKGTCNHVSDRLDDFLSISLNVKGKGNIVESLKDYVLGEKLEDSNKFRCSQCEDLKQESLVDAFRRTRLDHIPDNLVIGLKRFKYTLTGAEKINDRLDYPAELNMAPFTVQAGSHAESEVPPDLFELVGVVIHQGSLNFGHYWTYAKDHTTYDQNGGRWYRIEDSRAQEVTLENALEAGRGSTGRAFGLFDKSDNAYVLFYRRIGSKAHLNGFANSVSDEEKFASKAVNEDNNHARETANLFDQACQSYILGLMEKPKSSCNCLRCVHEYEKAAFSLGLHYLFRVAACDEKTRGVDHFVNALTAMAERNPFLSFDALRLIFSDDESVDRFLCSFKPAVRNKMNDMVVKFMEKAALQEPVYYGIASERVRKGMEQYELDPVTVLYDIGKAVFNRIDHIVAQRYPMATYCAFLQMFASVGPVEARYLARSSILEDCLSLLYVQNNDEANRRHDSLAKYMSTTERPGFAFGAVMDLIAFILTHVTEYNTTLGRGEESPATFNTAARLLINKGERLWMEMSKGSSDPRNPIMGLPAVALERCSVLTTTTAIQWPPARLIGALLSGYSDPFYAAKISNTLIQLIIDVRWESDYNRYLLAAEYICTSADVTMEVKARVFEAVLLCTPQDRDMYSRCIEWFDVVLGHIVASDDLRRTVTEWMHKMLFNNFNKVRRAMAQSIAGLIASDKDDLPPQSLIAAVTSDHIFLELLGHMAPVIDDSIMSQERQEYVRWPTRAYIALAKRMIDKYIPVATTDPVANYDAMAALGFTDAEKVQLGDRITRMAPLWDKATVYKRISDHLGWSRKETKKRASEELDDDGREVQSVKIARITLINPADEESSEVESAVAFESERDGDMDTQAYARSLHDDDDDDDDQWTEELGDEAVSMASSLGSGV
ncbi:Ubiquitin carboxyl-terminal hydrolase-like protein 5 [Elsinoe fawcettii]|nr:Ubiquitin carboxyl-terminal hydrolase-like protein 5 [Elsinoe fawcettii]